MREDTLAKIESEIIEWSYAKELPPAYHDFSLKHIDKADGDRYDLFDYSSASLHLGATAYFHEETMEYKLRVRRGLIEFCQVDFISSDLPTFTQFLQEHLFSLLDKLTEPELKHPLLLRTGIFDWEYGRNLPEKSEGFALFVRPAAPYPLTNGSYVIIDYSDFELGSNFTVYYNIFRAEFFAEARIKMMPDVLYEFDATELKTLTEKLSLNLTAKLQEIRRRSTN